MTMDVYAQTDASVRLEYKIVFENAPGRTRLTSSMSVYLMLGTNYPR